MKPRMKYEEGQRDMILMQHKYTFDYPDRTEHVTTTLVDYGTPTDSSMSRTVSLPVCILMRHLLTLSTKSPKSQLFESLLGVQRPLDPAVYTLVLDELAKAGIVFKDKVEKVVMKETEK
eukprot:TRINITY_DN1146_c0_g1_i2.p1 TRINITY_DN1146_c0_g1~~TRINITY_DN1146_c0_g1_i2.p1  ORF type:complete len:119 (+),score=23.18 TRINITY_DN1146_c0_g1_i2:548-904(+)